MIVRVVLRTFLVIGFCGANAQFPTNILNTFNLFANTNSFSQIPETKIANSYDFIIVGAGSGGSVVANRLSENSNWTVLLLEAGSDENFFTDVPLMAAMQGASSFNWGYKAEKLTTACLGAVEGRCTTARGKALGGTSVINFLLYTRGNKLDYDEWERLGNSGWSYNDILRYFIKSEDCTRCTSIDKLYHGKNGYLKIEHPHVRSPLLKRFLKAGLELGYKNIDPNGRYHLGFSEAQATMINGRRCSANRAFLKSIVNRRRNLHIITKARVTKILIDPISKSIKGVEVTKNKQRLKIFARKEVILSAGTINSPQLLMLSGVGPKEHLEELNIPVIQNLKVGYNLQDHFAMSTLVFLVNQSITVSDIAVQNPAEVINYLFNGRGSFTIPGGSLGLAFLQSKLSPKIEDYPDIEIVLGAGALNGDVYGTMRGLLGIPDDFDRKVYAPIRHLPGFSLAVVLMRPKSRGRILLKDNNPLHWPKIYPNYLEDSNDLDVMVEGIKMAIDISNTKSFRSLNTTLHNTPFLGCEGYAFGSDDYWRCCLRQVATTLGHHVGTCKMGADSDPDAVVDSRLRVKGIKGLRVVDASVMPNIVAGHTNAVVMMIGEKASDMIKEDWNI